MQQNMPQQMSPNAALGMLPGQMGYLQNIAQGGGAGAPISQLPAWASMVGAQNWNVQQGADQLAEQFNNGGGLFSTAYGSAQGQYQNQARLGQNAQLLQAQTQAMQQANQNQYGASGQLSQQGYGALGQLSNQGFGAAQLGSQLSANAANTAAGISANAAGQQFSAQNNASLAEMQRQLQLQQMGMQGAGLQGNLYNQNLNTGMGLGNQQLLANQNQLTGAYQNWYMSQPQNNPLLSMMYAGATGYPQLQQSTYNPGALGSLLGGLGGLAGGAASLIGLSDRRLKENITRVGKIADASLYAFNFKGSPNRQLGFMAQEVSKRHPNAVIRGDKNRPWMIDYTQLAKTLGVR
jgi:hypothetical protein